MLIKNTVLPQANIYSSKFFFDKLEDRYQKRIAQIVKRKTALLSKRKNCNRITKDKSSEQMITPSTQEISIINNVSNISKSNIKKDESSYNTIILTSKPRTIERFLSSFKQRNINTTPNITNNFNMIDGDLYEKEVNISNLNDNENLFDNVSEKQKNKNENKNNFLNEKRGLKNSYIKKIIENEKKQKENNNIYQRNKYAIEYLSSSLDSFVEFKNKLVTKAKYNKNYFTLSYSQALFLDYNNLGSKKNEKEKNYNYEVNEIIKEENESYSPKANNKLYIGQSAIIPGTKKKNNKNNNRLNNKKMQNKSLYKTVEYNIGNNKSTVGGKSLNKKALINNCKLKIPKTKLSMEIRNKRKTNENKEYKEYKNNLNINDNQNNMKNTLSPKFIKLKLFLEDLNKKEIQKKIIDKNRKKSIKSKDIKITK